MLQCIFLLRLREQQAVTAPRALTDHSPQSGCQRCRLSYAASLRGAVQPASRAAALGRRAAHCETAPSSAQSLLLCFMLFTSRADSGEELKRKYSSKYGFWVDWSQTWIVLITLPHRSIGVKMLEQAINICWSQSRLNRSHHGRSDIQSMQCYYGLFGNRWDCWGNSLLSSTTLLLSQNFRRQQKQFVCVSRCCAECRTRTCLRPVNPAERITSSNEY